MFCSLLDSFTVVVEVVVVVAAAHLVIEGEDVGVSEEVPVEVVVVVAADLVKGEEEVVEVTMDYDFGHHKQRLQQSMLPKILNPIHVEVILDLNYQYDK